VIISDSHRFLFVHVQKTGGSAIDLALKQVLPDIRSIPKSDRHASLATILKLEPELASYWTVGFVRNPWARMLSWYRMVDRFREGSGAGKVGYQQLLARNPFLAKASQEHQDFESFVLKGTQEFARLRKPQIQYLATSTRRTDFVGRQESLEADMRAIIARLGLPPLEIPQINVDPSRPDYRDDYTPAMRRRVEELFARDIEVFGYQF
jgi:hypothetical protein